MLRPAVVVVCALLAVPASAASEVWRCRFNGTWSGGAGAGRFTWRVTWTGSGDEWRMVGTGRDELGAFASKGTCTAHRCTITQAYTSGTQKGDTFHLAARYEDEQSADGNALRETFMGTWGTSETDRTSGGSWTAAGSCRAE